MLGVGAGAYPSDAALRGLSDVSENHEMMEEALEIMQMIWTCEPFHYEGTFWTAGFPEAEDGAHASGAISALRREDRDRHDGAERALAVDPLRGRARLYPLSVYAGDAFLKAHWGLRGRRGGGRAPPTAPCTTSCATCSWPRPTPRPSALAIEGGWLGPGPSTCCRPTSASGSSRPAHDPGVDAAEVDLTTWPSTWDRRLGRHRRGEVPGVAGPPRRIRDDHDLLLDYADDPEPYNESTRRLTPEVAPRGEDAGLGGLSCTDSSTSGARHYGWRAPASFVGPCGAQSDSRALRTILPEALRGRASRRTTRLGSL